jgi:phosphoribosylformylglycinamidine synthase
VPDLDDPQDLVNLVNAVNALRARGQILAYHDRSDGGLLATVAEMAFAGHVGVALNIDMLVTEGDGITDSRAEYGDAKNWAGQVSARREELTLKALFTEELGVVLQVATAERNAVMQTLREHGLSKHSHFIGKTRPESSGLARGKGELSVWRDTKEVFPATAGRPAPGLGQRELEDLPAARQPGLRRCRACGGWRSRRPRPACGADVRTRQRMLPRRS